jgi:hypothetical protein
MPKVAVVAHAPVRASAVAWVNSGRCWRGTAFPIRSGTRLSRAGRHPTPPGPCARRRRYLRLGRRRDGPALHRCRRRDGSSPCDPSGRHSEYAGGQPGNTSRPHRGGAGRSAWGPSPAGRRIAERRAFCGDGRRRVRRPHDQRTPAGDEGPYRPAAYLYAGARNLSARRVNATIEADGKRFFKGRLSCVLAGNVGKLLGGSRPFAGRSRTTGSSSSAWSRPRIRSNGPAPSGGSRWRRGRHVAVRRGHAGQEVPDPARSAASLRA